MPIVHQEKGFDFVIEAKDKEPPKVHIKGAKGKYMLVRIGKPEEELPFIEKYEKIEQDEVDWVWELIADHQINFLTAWERIHGGVWKGGPEPVMMKLEAKPKTEYRLRLKLKAKKDRIKEALGGIHDKRFLSLQKKLIWDLDRAEFRNIDLVLYMRLGGWSHTGGTYSNTMDEVKALCEAMFGYALPEKIGKYFMKKYRYASGKGLVGLWPVVSRYHEERIKKNHS